jgi:hypothetical protein
MKGVTLVPLLAAPRTSVERYLAARGATPEMIAWKYFDARFNRGRNRALVWMQGSDIRGFIGLIPFSLRDRDGVRDATWTCDWSLDDPRRSPGMGIVLLRAAIDATGFAMSLGGNELTRSLLPRIAAQIIADAGAVYVLPLRLGYLLEKVDRRIKRRIPAAPVLATTLLGSIPLAGARHPDAGIDIQPGVAPLLEHALARPSQPTPAPAYDLDQVQWQCGRCPEIESWTCLDARDAAASAAALVFRARCAPGDWRLVWWEPPGGRGPDGAKVLRAVTAFARAHGARSLSAIVSRADGRAASRLRAEGFRLQRGGQPLYVNPSDRAAFVPFDRVGALSYLDTDLAHLP